MEEYDDPTESLQDKLNEEAKERKERQRWLLWVAISTALFAVFAAISSLFAGHLSNEALIEQIKASDSWNYYQAKSIKAEIIGRSVHPDSARIAKLNSDGQTLQEQAKEEEKSSEERLQKHVVISKAVTLFQIAIAISAISVVTSKRFLWFASIIIALIALGFFVGSFFY